jgi:MYXO-CTERM domain-containing protein
MKTLASFHVTRARLCRLALVLVLAAAPGALAGDRPTPQTHIDEGPEAVTTATTADFVLRATVGGRTLPGALFWCSLDEGEFLPCEPAHRVEGLGVGPHLLVVYAVDPETGRTDAEEPAFWEWMVEEGAPPMDAGSPGGDGGVPGDGGTSGGQDGGSSTDGGTSGGQDAGTELDAGTSGGQDAGSPGNDAGTSTGSDAGTSGNPDAGSPGNPDAGTSTGSDAGSPGNPDAGTSGGDDAGPGDIEDAGSPGGGGVPPGDDGVPPEEALDYLGGGVGCTGAPAPSAVAGLLLLVLAIRRRRR